MRRTRALAVLIAAAVAATVAAVAPAASADEPQPRIMTILDASGSMKEKDAGGQTRLAAAKEAVTGLIAGVPDGTAMGVRVYGSEYAGEDTGPGCRDTELLAPVAELDTAAKKRATAEVRATDALGMTPIGATLKTAAKELGDAGPRRIVLVSDGEDTCAPPSPCQVARELKGAGLDLVIDTVGLKVTGKARSELRCIAKATKGTYVDAGDADELGDGLDDSVKRALSPYEASGAEVRGGKTCAEAPRLEPGQYRDAFGYGDKRWYTVRVRPGQSLRFSAAVIPEDGEYERASFTRIRLHLPGADKPFDDEQTIKSSWANVISAGIATDRLTWDAVPKGRQAVDVCAQVVDDVRATGAQSVELAVGLGGRAVDADGAPAADGRGAGAEGGQATGESPSAAPGEDARDARGDAQDGQDAQNAGASSDMTRPLPLALAAAVGLAVALLVRFVITRRRTS
ncbi:von Willebrand factor type A domain protein [Streptomyces sp. YIM 130001]|uniref:VWA domain-containing protein n=1 Tax=Streptomyces sp. YIM 130001 TaxID=2259644 RepID=UPI000E64EA1D|nr:VWA domain-containing protein [Streptomyces sp. YIM 130001]RII20843.1 von Willebrand factor type A domain protein [Streptomyces sp. YIM 130001]